MRQLLDQISPVLEEVDLHESHSTLVGRLVELKGLLEEKKKSFYEAKLVLETSSSNPQIAVTELEEENTALKNLRLSRRSGTI